MDKKYIFERYYWIDSKIKANAYPNRKDLSVTFGITVRQAARDIEYLKSVLNVPIEYSPEKRGYYYSDKDFEMPRPKVTERELIGLVMADCMADLIPDRTMFRDIDSFTKKICQANGFDLDDLKKKVSIKNLSHAKVEPSIFDAILKALIQKRKIDILYKAQYKNEQTQRVVNPLHLILYNGNWLLYTFCEKREDYRTFALSGISKVTVLAEVVKKFLAEKDLKKKIEENFGIFLQPNEKEAKFNVQLCFKRSIADRIRNLVWKDSQKMVELGDGSILLSFEVSDFTEISEEILKYGTNVEVIEPHELREFIKNTISEMVLIYQEAQQ